MRTEKGNLYFGPGFRARDVVILIEIMMENEWESFPSKGKRNSAKMLWKTNENNEIVDIRKFVWRYKGNPGWAMVKPAGWYIADKWCAVVGLKRGFYMGHEL